MITFGLLFAFLRSVGAYLSSVDVLVPRAFRHAQGLQVALEREFPGLQVTIKAADVPRATADQVTLKPSHGCPENDTDFLLTEIQRVIDTFCKGGQPEKRTPRW